MLSHSTLSQFNYRAGIARASAESKELIKQFVLDIVSKELMPKIVIMMEYDRRITSLLPRHVDHIAKQYRIKIYGEMNKKCGARKQGTSKDKINYYQQFNCYILAASSFKNILKHYAREQTGKNIRISTEAAHSLQILVEMMINNVLGIAIKHMDSANRKTLQRPDLQHAIDTYIKFGHFNQLLATSYHKPKKPKKQRKSKPKLQRKQPPKKDKGKEEKSPPTPEQEVQVLQPVLPQPPQRAQPPPPAQPVLPPLEAIQKSPLLPPPPLEAIEEESPLTPQQLFEEIPQVEEIVREKTPPKKQKKQKKSSKSSQSSKSSNKVQATAKKRAKQSAKKPLGKEFEQLYESSSTDSIGHTPPPRMPRWKLRHKQRLSELRKEPMAKRKKIAKQQQIQPAMKKIAKQQPSTGSSMSLSLPAPKAKQQPQQLPVTPAPNRMTDDIELSGIRKSIIKKYLNRTPNLSSKQHSRLKKLAEKELDLQYAELIANSPVLPKNKARLETKLQKALYKKNNELLSAVSSIQLPKRTQEKQKQLQKELNEEYKQLYESSLADIDATMGHTPPSKLPPWKLKHKQQLSALKKQQLKYTTPPSRQSSSSKKSSKKAKPSSKKAKPSSSKSSSSMSISLPQIQIPQSVPKKPKSTPKSMRATYNKLKQRRHISTPKSSRKYKAAPIIKTSSLSSESPQPKRLVLTPKTTQKFKKTVKKIEKQRSKEKAIKQKPVKVPEKKPIAILLPKKGQYKFKDAMKLITPLRSKIKNIEQQQRDAEKQQLPGNIINQLEAEKQKFTAKIKNIQDNTMGVVEEASLHYLQRKHARKQRSKQLQKVSKKSSKSPQQKEAEEEKKQEPVTKPKAKKYANVRAKYLDSYKATSKTRHANIPIPATDKRRKTVNKQRWRF